MSTGLNVSVACFPHETPHSAWETVGSNSWEIPFTTPIFHQTNLPIYLIGCLVAPVLRTMAKNAVDWAKKKGLNRISAVHGAEEYRVPTEETFEHSEIDRTRTTASASVQLEAGPHCVLCPTVTFWIGNTLSPAGGQWCADG